MSTVVVVRKNGRACIAGDTLVSLGDMRQHAEMLVGMSKIIQCPSAHLKDAYLAVVGASAHQMVLQSYFASHADEMDFSSRAAIFESWRKLHRALKEDYHLNPEEDREDPYQSTHVCCLMMNERGIFGVYPLRSVSEYSRFWALGSGDEYALGAMHAIYERCASVEEIATAGIEAAAMFDKSTSLPLTMNVVELRSEEELSAECEPLPLISKARALAAYAVG